jgi:Transposase and inactivated derivatives
MARYKEYSYDQGKLVPISFHKQIIPGSFEFALNDIVDNVLDLSVFEGRFCNDETGAPAYNPRILLKIILYAYSRGILHSRDIARCCTENVMFMALSADTQPHFTTIAHFVSSMHDEITPLFRNILLYCAEEKLISSDMFAIDGCKISSNCAKEWSGTIADFEKRKEKIEYHVRFLLRKHKECDKTQLGDNIIKKEKKAINHLRSKVKKINRWLAKNNDKEGKWGLKKSNITDNETAKMQSSHGIVQGYNAGAAVDEKRQVIVHAETFSEGNDQGLLKPMIDGVRDNFKAIGENDIFTQAKITADSGFHSDANMKMLFEEKIDGYVADNQFRKRDPKFATANRHKKPIDRKRTPVWKKNYFSPNDFIYNETTKKLTCPAGNPLYVRNSKLITKKGQRGIVYVGWKTKCRTCEIRSKCLRSSKSEFRQVVKFDKSTMGPKGTFTKQMIEKFDTALGRFVYSRRMGTVEPVFANICHTIGLDRFTLRTRKKTDTQWKLFSIVHNIFKIYRYGASYAH